MASRIQYVPAFDGLRALAVVAVLLFHGSYGSVTGGWIGVDLFFVLSGFLITSVLQQEWQANGSISLPNFYLRRALRLLAPVFLLVLVCNLFWSSIPGSTGYQLQATLAALFYAANLVDGRILGPLGHLWSLAVEEHFYFVWPVLAGLLFRFRRKKQAAAVAALFLASTALRIVTELHPVQPGFFVLDPYRFSLTRADGILLGCLLAICGSRIRIPRLLERLLLPATLLLFAAMVLFLSSSSGHWRHGGFVATNLLCACAVFAAWKAPDAWLLANPVARWIGTRSYGIYVYHVPIFLSLEFLRQPGGPGHLLWVLPLMFGLTFAAAELSYRCIERPLLRMKGRLAPK